LRVWVLQINYCKYYQRIKDSNKNHPEHIHSDMMPYFSIHSFL
jgi:hypothetical protein